ncbi:2OG-Fe dioxygenase family protein [Methylocella sp.]|uniref:2OG-Fe dioxygenase family protein n=1 Tax=Methylocella sp. TaxID=1978226 RepID=UPI0037842E5B
MPMLLSPIAEALSRQGFAFVHGDATRAALDGFGLADWAGFANSWNDLGVDAYMADGGRYRRRRFAAYAVSRGGVLRKPHQPHYQSMDYNALNGGIERWFSPVAEEIGAHPAMLAAIRTGFALFDPLTPRAARPEVWHVEAHQFRIEANAREAGRPTPEGLHRDGVDWVFVLLVGRDNVARGETTTHGLTGEKLGAFTLTQPCDAAFVDDSRVFHGVTPVTPIDPEKPASRDVLVLTFRR